MTTRAERPGPAYFLIGFVHYCYYKFMIIHLLTLFNRYAG